MRVKILLNFQLKNEVSWTNCNTYKIIFNWQPFMNRVYNQYFYGVKLWVSISFDGKLIICLFTLARLTSGTSDCHILASELN